MFIFMLYTYINVIFLYVCFYICYIYICLYICYIYILINLYVEYIMQNARLDEVQAGIKIARRRNINNLRYAHDTMWKKAKRNETAS